MLILAIDTSLKHCSVAIESDGEIIFHRSEAAANKQAELLPLMITDALKQSTIDRKSIEKIAVTIGPGSFTGVRVGLAFAKGLAISIGCELVGITSFEAFIQSVKQSNNVAQNGNLKILCAINIAGSIFMNAQNGDETTLPPTRFEDYSTLKDFKDYQLCGFNIAPEVKDVFDFIGDDFINPDILCQIARTATPNTHPPVPRYMRGAEAKLWQAKFPPNH